MDQPGHGSEGTAYVLKLQRFGLRVYPVCGRHAARKFEGETALSAPQEIYELRFVQGVYYDS